MLVATHVSTQNRGTYLTRHESGCFAHLTCDSREERVQCRIENTEGRVQDVLDTRKGKRQTHVAGVRASTCVCVRLRALRRRLRVRNTNPERVFCMLQYRSFVCAFAYIPTCEPWGGQLGIFGGTPCPPDEKGCCCVIR